MHRKRHTIWQVGVAGLFMCSSAFADQPSTSVTTRTDTKPKLPFHLLGAVEAATTVQDSLSPEARSKADSESEYTFLLVATDKLELPFKSTLFFEWTLERETETKENEWAFSDPGIKLGKTFSLTEDKTLNLNVGALNYFGMSDSSSKSGVMSYHGPTAKLSKRGFGSATNLRASLALTQLNFLTNRKFAELDRSNNLDLSQVVFGLGHSLSEVFSLDFSHRNRRVRSLEGASSYTIKETADFSYSHKESGLNARFSYIYANDTFDSLGKPNPVFVAGLQGKNSVEFELSKQLF